MVTDLLEPHLWAALVLAVIVCAVIVCAVIGFFYWRFYRGSE